MRQRTSRPTTARRQLPTTIASAGRKSTALVEACPAGRCVRQAAELAVSSGHSALLNLLRSIRQVMAGISRVDG